MEIPDWLIEKINNNDKYLTHIEFGKLDFFYKKITGLKLKKKCDNCIADAYIVIRIYLKNKTK